MDKPGKKKRAKPTPEEIVSEGNARAVKIYEAWKGGRSYRLLAEDLDLSFGRIRQLVKKGKKLST